MRLRRVITVAVVLLVAVVLQTTLFSQIEYFTPDLVLLVALLLTLTRIRPELTLLLAFVAGLSVDLLGSAVLGLRAMVFTMVAYLGLRTRDRADVGRVVTGIWAGVLTLAGVVLLILVGTLFGQTVLLGEGVVDRLFLVPLANAFLAFVFAPLFVRLVDRDPTALRYA
ncbi:MAG TPA: rod shape-determining protein MreD [Acidimicrobiia bacterium]|nr:rod shape-determining protein MreD [Acidimicrobiia bacterium]